MIVAADETAGTTIVDKSGNANNLPDVSGWSSSFTDVHWKTLRISLS